MNLTREDLDAEACTCDDAEHGVIEMRSRCHPETGLKLVYKQGTGEMRLICFGCDNIVACLLVGSRQEVMQ